MMRRVRLVTAGEDRLPPGTADAIRAFADFRAARCGTPDELVATFPDAEVLWMFGPNLCLKPEALDRMPCVRALMRSGSGLDALPLGWAKAHGVGVFNTPESIAECVAEHAVALLISYVRQVPQYNARAKAGYEWGKVEGMDWHLSHRTLGLVGYGNIARRVERMMSGFDMTVIHCDPFVEGSLPLDEVLRRSDYVSVHCPLTPETEGLIDARRLALMKPNAILVNTSRGAVVDEDALADALDSGRLGGAAIDVMREEPPPAESRLLRHPKCIVTPHVAAFSCDFERNFFAASVERLRSICEGLDAEGERA
jgi:phosphoglycerate dehydrogenase-like enzyme